MVIQNIDYPNYQALKRLIESKQVNGAIPKSELKYITYMATEHGISKDEVIELMDLIEIKR